MFSLVRYFFVSCILISGAIISMNQSAASESPEVLVKVTVDKILTQLEKRKTELQSNPQIIYALIEEHIYPIVDFDTTHRFPKFVLKKHFRLVVAEGKLEPFIAALKIHLRNTYAVAFKSYDGHQVRIVDTKTNGQGSVVVKTELFKPGGKPIAVDYIFSLSSGSPLLYDLKVSGISLSQSLYTSLSATISAKGVQAGIDSLGSANKTSKN